MRWLLHGNLNPAVGEALHRHKHDTKTAPDIGLPAEAAAMDVVKAAHKSQLDIITPDPSLAQALFESKWNFDRSIVYLQLEGGEVEQDDAVDRLFARYKRLTPGRLYTVTDSRVKVRQLPNQA